MILLANYQDSSWKKTMTLRPFEAVVVKKDA
jgi:alpha-glucosidase